MVIVGKYTSSTDVEIVTALTFSSSSVPTLAQVNTIISDVENEIDSLALGQVYTTNEYIDVNTDPEQLITLATSNYGGYSNYVGYRGRYREGIFIIPSKFPIITVSNLWINEAELDETANWDEQTEGPADNASFITLKRTIRNKTLGYALYFFANLPLKGRARIKANLLWGWDMDTSILKRYATLKTSERVIINRMGTNNPDQLSTFTQGGGILQNYVPTAYDQRLRVIQSEIKDIERDLPGWVEVAMLRR